MFMLSFIFVIVPYRVEAICAGFYRLLCVLYLEIQLSRRGLGSHLLFKPHYIFVDIPGFLTSYVVVFFCSMIVLLTIVKLLTITV